jgi:cysteine desulfurase / selenocysteine lyase
MSTNKFDIKKIRNDFPILNKEINGHQLIYLDNAATTQKPKIMIDTVNYYYLNQNSNIHRAVHTLSKLSTESYDKARNTVKKFINAKHFEEIIFTRGTTEAINLVASSWGRKFLNPGDEVIITEMEHHSNIVPWQMICQERKAKLKIAPMTDDAELILNSFYDLINDNTKLVSLVHVSNSLGTINPVKEIIEKSHKVGAKVLVDAAQSIQHKKVDVTDMDCDFLAFSGHKIYGPTGIGVLYGKKELLDLMPPYQGGGDMIMSCSFEKTTYNYLPFKFEAGTQNIAGAIGLEAAINYINNIGIENINQYEDELLNYTLSKIKNIEGLKLIGNAKSRSSIISFVFDDIHPNDLGSMLDVYGIAVRTGQHCTEPVMIKFNLPATTRASLAFYNTFEEIDTFIHYLNKIVQKLRS